MESPEQNNFLDSALKQDLLTFFEEHLREKIDVLEAIRPDSHLEATGTVRFSGAYFVTQAELGDIITCLESNLSYCLPKIHQYLERLIKARDKESESFLSVVGRRITGLDEKTDTIIELRDRLEKYL